MKALMTFLFCLLLSFTVEADVKYETYNTDVGNWDIDTTCLTLDDVSIMDSIASLVWTADYTSPHSLAVYVAPTQKHDTLREYVTGLDTVIILHRIECDTNFTKFFVENDSTFVQIEGITCDTIFRVEYRDVWAAKVPVWLDSLDWHVLLHLIQQQNKERR